ncbi:hypothetical protein BDZ89DRAFT_1064893 [Hymenopellis radicata]|nr:hypothetical protein BDZ89DRAFT_1064893 [Hymenopellis radicata]
MPPLRFPLSMSTATPPELKPSPPSSTSLLFTHSPPDRPSFKLHPLPNAKSLTLCPHFYILGVDCDCDGCGSIGPVCGYSDGDCYRDDDDTGGPCFVGDCIIWRCRHSVCCYIESPDAIADTGLNETDEEVAAESSAKASLSSKLTAKSRTVTPCAAVFSASTSSLSPSSSSVPSTTSSVEETPTTSSKGPFTFATSV